MTIKNGILVLLLAVLVALGGWYIFTHTQSLPHALNDAGDRQVKEETDYYSIQASYPNTTRLASRTDSTKGADEKAVAAMEEFINQTVAAFKKDADQALTPDEKARLKEEGIKYSLNIAYHAYNSGSFASFEFDIYEDTGGAHPNGFYKTFVFDLKGDQVTLSDLFTSDSAYLTRIASEVRKQVEEKLTAEAGEGATSTVFEEGLTPTEDNFSNWVDNDGTLTVLIPPYQVAAYAAGSFEIPIPLDELKDILKPEVQ